MINLNSIPSLLALGPGVRLCLSVVASRFPAGGYRGLLSYAALKDAPLLWGVLSSGFSQARQGKRKSGFSARFRPRTHKPHVLRPLISCKNFTSLCSTATSASRIDLVF